MTLYIRDDLGHAWYFHPKEKRMRLVLADLEADSREEFEGNGYDCESLEDGIRLLNEMGYISGVEYDDVDIDEYFKEDIA